MFAIECQTTVEQLKTEVKDEDGYTHGLGMLVRFQELWAYFLAQKTPANPKSSAVEEQKPKLNKTTKQPKGDKSFDEGALCGDSIVCGETKLWKPFKKVVLHLSLPKKKCVFPHPYSWQWRKKFEGAMLLSSLPTANTLRTVPEQEKMSGIVKWE